MDAGLASLHVKYPQVVVLKVDIRNWGTPVCQQYNIESVPHMMLYDSSGRKRGEGDQALEELAKLLKR